VDEHSTGGSELTNELAAQRLANSSFSILSAALLLCGGHDYTDTTRHCDKCSGAMTHLSNLQPYRGGAAVRVSRCYGCNHVVSEEIR
jgi:hypothetical protein